MLYPTKGVSELTRFTPEKVEEKYGLTPAQYPDFAALRGDPSDNLPGIPGVGEKTAAKWINQFGSFAELVERADEVKGKAGREPARPPGVGQAQPPADRAGAGRRAAAAVRGPGARRRTTATALAMVLDTLEFRNPNFRERLFAVDPGARGGRGGRRSPRASSVDGTVLGAGELAPLAGRARHGRRSAWPPSTPGRWARAASPRSRWPPPAGPAAWFDPARAGRGRRAGVRGWLADAGRPKVLHNAKSAMRVFAEHGWSVDGVTMDTALAAYLVKPGRRSFALDALSVEYLGRELAPAAAADGQLAFGADDEAEAEALMVQARAVLDLGEAFAARLEEVGARRPPPGGPSNASPRSRIGAGLHHQRVGLGLLVRAEGELSVGRRRGASSRPRYSRDRASSVEGAAAGLDQVGGQRGVHA